MENITNQSSINQSNTNSVYSSVEVSKQQQVTVNIPNNNVIDVYTNSPTPFQNIIEDTLVAPMIQYSQSVLNNQPVQYIEIHGEIIKEKRKWRINDETNSECYETGNLDWDNNRSGLSYVYLNDELKEIHEYKDDRRIGHYKIFKYHEMFEYDDSDTLVYEGEYKIDIFGYYKRSGYGKEYKNGRLYFEGEWKKNYPNGIGSLYKEDGSIEKEGEWDNGYLVIDKKYFFWQTKSFLEKSTVANLLISEYIIGILFIFNFLFFELSDALFVLSFNGLMMVLISVIQQYSNYFCHACTGVLLIIMFLNFIGHLSSFREFPVFLLIIIGGFQVYIIAAAITVFIQYYSQPYPSSYTVINPIISTCLEVLGSTNKSNRR